VGKENVAVTLKDLVQDNSRMRTVHQFRHSALALLDWRVPQVFVVQFDQVERDQQCIVTVALVANEVEYRQTTVVGDDGFTIEQE
jgi:hypothetical protein